MGVKEAGTGPPEGENSINDRNNDDRSRIKKGIKLILIPFEISKNRASYPEGFILS